jgi:alpha-L-fucosidase 2
MLLQSHEGALDILPALPMAWREGEVRGLKARGGFEVDIAWKDGLVSRLRIHSLLGGTCRIRTAIRMMASYGSILDKIDAANGNSLLDLAPQHKPLSTVNSASISPVVHPGFSYAIKTASGGMYELVPGPLIR